MIYGQDRAHLTWDDPFAEFREKNLSRRGGSRWRAGMKNRRNSVFDVLNVAAPCQWLSAEDAVFVALARCHGTPFEEEKKGKEEGKKWQFREQSFFHPSFSAAFLLAAFCYDCLGINLGSAELCK